MKNTNDKLVPLTMDKEKEDLDLYMQRIKDIDRYSDLPEMESNPFICLVADDIDSDWKRIQSEKNVVQARDGDGSMITLKDQRIFYRPVYSDKSKFTKLYKQSLRIMFQLTHGSLKLFGYIMENMNFIKNSDMVYIDKDEAMVWCEYGKNSKSAIYNSLIELSVKGLICKTNKKWLFYVNPQYAFNGNRVTLIQDIFLSDDDQQPANFIARKITDYKTEERKMDEELTKRFNDFE